jgi:U3 small nucleolar RNA-associated protein 7
MKRYLRKRSKNIIDERKLRMEAILKKEKEERQRNISGKEVTKLPPVLARFEKKSD